MDHSGSRTAILRFLTVWTAVCPVASSAGIDLTPLGQTIGYFVDSAQGRFAGADFDGDGLRDVVFSGRSNTPGLHVLGKKSDGSLGLKLQFLVPDDGQFAGVLTYPDDDGPRVVTVGATGVARLYGGWPLRPVGQFPVVSGAVSAAVGDVDRDGTHELLVLSSDGAHAYRLPDGLEGWHYPFMLGSDIAIGQLDGDPALEIVLTGPSEGRIFDGATHGQEWFYAGGFGRRLAVPPPSGNAAPWAGLFSSDFFTVFASNPWSPRWSLKGTSNFHELSAADIAGDGRTAFLLSESGGGVHVFDAVSQTPLLHVPQPPHSWGPNALGVEDLDGDGRGEIIFNAATTTMSTAAMAIVDGQSGASRWGLDISEGPYLSTAFADLEGTGHLKLIASSVQYGRLSTLSIFDAHDGIELWRSPVPEPEFEGSPPDPYNIGQGRVTVLDRGSSKAIVLAGSYWSDVRITLVDGQTKQASLVVMADAENDLRGRQVQGLAAFDFDEDGIEDIVLGTHPQTSITSGIRLQVFSGSNGSLLWSAPLIGANFMRLNDVLVAPRSGQNASGTLIALLPDQLIAYDGRTGAQIWQLDTDITVNGGTYIPYGASGPEIALFARTQEGGQLLFYDARTRLLLRQHRLDREPRSLKALGGTIERLLVAFDDSISIISGVTAQISASSDNIGRFSGSFYVEGQIAVSSASANQAIVAVGTEAALTRFRVTLDDAIFSSGFDAQ